jgi:hypothetical protein
MMVLKAGQLYIRKVNLWRIGDHGALVYLSKAADKLRDGFCRLGE